MLNWDGYVGSLQSIKKEYLFTSVTFKLVKISWMISVFLLISSIFLLIAFFLKILRDIQYLKNKFLELQKKLLHTQQSIKALEYLYLLLQSTQSIEHYFSQKN